jgi:nicotinamide mononucleotide transporter
MNTIIKWLATLSPIEWLAAVATLLNVYLVLKNSIWNWLWGVVAVALYAYVFWTGHLYSNMWLQVAFYLPMQAIGWWMWLRGGPQKNDDLPITSLSNKARLGWFAVSLPIAGAWGFAAWWLAVQAHQPIPAIPVLCADAFTTGMSVVGQILLTRKHIENWAWWVVVNVVYAGYLLPASGLWVSVGLYAILLVMAILGWREWQKKIKVANKEQDR